MELAGKKILVIGMARSGIAAAKVLAKRRALITIYDQKPLEQLDNLPDEISKGIKLWAGREPVMKPGAFDMVVVSPGVSLKNSLVSKALDHEIPVMGEVELAYRLKSPGLELLGVTGTNGKTTTTSLLADILRRSGQKAVAAGNIGVPLVSVVDQMAEGMVVAEISSFQLETVSDFHPLCSCIINITPDHLDRHQTMENYTSLKARIFANQKESEFAFLNGDDPLTSQMVPPCKVGWFSAARVLKEGVWVEEGNICLNLDGDQQRVGPVAEVRLRGRHNLENVLCATGMAGAVGVPGPVIARALFNFKGVRHRMEEVAEIEGVLYVNDSKGTNPESTIKALESFSEPVVLIAGGRSKGADFTELARIIRKRVKALVLVGEARSIIREKVKDEGFAFPLTETGNMEEAVLMARDLAQPGEVVLLSPACASWDMFNNYEERGDLFCQIVKSFREE